MHVTMVKKKLADGSDCRKCADVTAYLQARGFWERIDEVVWAHEDDPQSPGTRAEVPVVQIDTTFGSPERPLVKFNPLANWTSKQVWAYIREHEVPYNALHERGFFSIGCEPCTRPINPGQHEREGRWWWEEETLKECGLHAGNVQPPRAG